MPSSFEAYSTAESKHIAASQRREAKSAKKLASSPRRKLLEAKDLDRETGEGIRQRQVRTRGVWKLVIHVTADVTSWWRSASQKGSSRSPSNEGSRGRSGRK